MLSAGLEPQNRSGSQKKESVSELQANRESIRNSPLNLGQYSRMDSKHSPSNIPISASRTEIGEPVHATSPHVQSPELRSMFLGHERSEGRILIVNLISILLKKHKNRLIGSAFQEDLSKFCPKNRTLLEVFSLQSSQRGELRVEQLSGSSLATASKCSL